MNLKAFAGFAAWGLVAASISLIFVFAATIFFGSAESLVVNGINVSTSAPNGATSGGGIIVKNDTTVLYNFTLNITSGNNISVINITFPSWPFDSASANISLVNTSSVPATVQLGGPVLTGWSVRFIENFTNGGIKTVQLNGSLAPATINGSNITWFAFNATTNITGAGNLSDNHTMTWDIYVANATESALIKTTTLVDNNPPRIFNVIPKLNSTRQSYLGGTSSDLFQLNVSEMNLNVSSSTSNDGSVNVTLWIKKSTVTAWSKQTMLCYNATGGFKPNGPTNSLYTCNTTLGLTNGGFLGTLTEGSIVNFFFNASDLVLNAGDNGTQSYALNATIDRTAPTSTNVLSNVSYAKNTSYVTVSARFSDSYELGNATLATNESGTWTNYTTNKTSIGSITGSYNSPLDLGVTTAYSVNFTWRNDSIATDTIVAWQIRATDEAGNSHTTALQSFVVDVTSPAVGFLSPGNASKQNISGTFAFNASVNDSSSGVSVALLQIANSTNFTIYTMTQDPTGYFRYALTSTLLPDGLYNATIIANDTVNNLNNTQNTTIQIDNNAPTISVILPAANANISGSFRINATVNDGTYVWGVQYKISNATHLLSALYESYLNMAVYGAAANVTGGANYSALNETAGANIGDGLYNVTIWANDSTNNIAQTNVSVYIDNNAPTLINLDTTLNVANVTSPASGATYFPGRSYTFNISATDNIGVFYVIARINGTNYTTTQYGDVTGRTRNFSTTITDLAAMAGGHEVQWYINDTTGNQRSENVWKYVIAQNASAYATISANQTTVERGTFFNITSIAFANAGILTTVNATMFANTTPGDSSLQQIITANRLASGGTYNITSSATLPVGPINFTANITVHENYTINSTVASVTVTIVDTIAPPVVLLNASASPVYVNGTIRKTGGTITLNVSAFENTNGWGFPNNLTVNVYANVTNGTQVFIGNLTNTSGYGHYSPTEVGGTITIPGGLTDGNLTFNFTVADKQGNIGFNDTSKRSNFVVSIDNTAPALSGPVPLNSTFNKGTATELFQINVTEVNLNSSQNITLYWGFTPTMSPLSSKTLLCTGTGANPYNFVGSNWICNTTLDLTVQADGESVYYFFNTSNATHPGGDLAGNAGSYGNILIPLNSTVDRTFPSVGVLLPLGSANVSGSFTLNISANNTPAGVSNVSYRITNNTLWSEMILLTRGAGTAYNGYWNGTNNTVVPGLADGVYRININATDFAGNQNTTVNVTITIDNTKPNVTIVRPTTNLNFSSSIIINATVRDSGIAYSVASGDIKAVEYRLANSSWGGSWIALTNTSTNGLNFDYYNATNDTSANFADGAYNITIKATDYADNFNDTQNVTIYIDRNAPSVSIKGPTANQFIKGTFNITAEVNDAVWVKSVWYRISNGTHATDVLGSAHLAMTNASGVNTTGGGYFNATNITSAVLFGDGSYNITVAANDTLNQVTYANVTVTIDNNAPVQFGITTNTSNPVSGTEYFPGRLYRFNKTFNDTIGVTSVILQLNATNYTAFRYEGDAQGGNWSANVTDLAANTTGYPIIWYANDSAGNWLTTALWYYVIAKNTSAFTTISINQTTVERGNFVNITIRSTIRAEINTTIYTNYSGALASLTTFVPYPPNNQNITFTGMLKGIWNITANTTITENYTANATLESVTFSVTDTARPALRIYDYVNGTSVKPGDSIRLNVSITDNYGIDSAFNVSAFFNGTTIGSWVFAGNITNSTFSSNASSAWANGTITIPSSGLNVAGNRTINITILDSSGNLGMNDSFVINMDPGAPTWVTNSTTPGSDIQYFPGRTYYFNVTITDEPLGVGTVFLEFNGTNYTASRFGGTIYSGNWSVSITDLAANTSVIGYRFRWYMNDSSGQWNTSDAWNYTIYKNTTAYTRILVNQTSVERGNFVNITVYSPIRAEINTTIYTNYSGALASLTTFVPYPLNNQNITFTGMLKGIWNITANTTTTENYTANATLESITFVVQDTSRPGLRIYDYTNGTRVKPGDTIRLNVSITDNYGIDSAFNVSAFFNGTTIGSWVFAGNITNSTFSSNATSAWANGTITIPSSGLNVAGNRTINITILDSASNLGMNDSFVINMDPGAPTWTINSTTPGSDIGYFPGRTYYFNVTLTDEPLGVSNVFLEFNGTNYTASRFGNTAYSGNWSVSITDLAANSSATGYYFRWYMNDTLGQWNTSDYWNYTIYTNTSAIARLEVNITTWERGTAINITSYSPISALINTTIYANFSAFALGTINYRPYPAGNQNITSVGTNLAVGAYNITVNTTRNENYSANASVYMVTITVQDSSPVSSLVSPTNNSNHTGTLSINVSVTDQGGVDTVRFNISNNTWIGTTGYLNSTGNVGNHYNATVNIATISDGNYNITILPNDTFGNLNSSYYFHISIDSTGPVIIFSYQAEGTRLTGYTPGNNSYRSGAVSINVTITDEFANFTNNSVFVRIGNATHWMGPQFRTVNLTSLAVQGIFNYSNLTTTPSLRDGLYNFSVTVNDTLGNNRTNVTFFNVDNTAPTAVIALSNSTRGTYRPNSTEQIRVQINDASQTNATIDIYARNTSSVYFYRSISAAPGTASVYNLTVDTSELVTNQMVRYYISATDNASNAVTLTGTAASPLSNITIDVNCGNAGSPLSFCSGTSLTTTRNGWASVNILTSQIESASSLQSNFTIDNVTKRADIWGLFNYTYFNNGTRWLSFDPNSPPSTNTLTMFNMSGNGQTYWFNINSTTTDVIFRIQ